MFGMTRWTKPHYPSNIFCSWTVYGMTGPDGDPNTPLPVTLSFQNGNIDLEANYDWLKVYDGGRRSADNLDKFPVDPGALRGPAAVGGAVALQRNDDGRIPLRWISCDVLDSSRKCYTDQYGNNMLNDIVAPSGILYVTFQ